MEINIGRVENRARYTECGNRIKKAFAKYRAAFKPSAEKLLTWEGGTYKLKEDGSFEFLFPNERNSITKLEKDVKYLEEFVEDKIGDDEVSETDHSDMYKQITHLCNIVADKLPVMMCVIGRSVDDGLYWVSSGEVSFYDLEEFRKLVKENTTFQNIYAVPLEYSYFDFEKDKISGYMSSVEVEEASEDDNLDDLFKSVLSTIKSLGVIRGIFRLGDVTLNVFEKRSPQVRIVCEDVIVDLRVDDINRKIVYTVSCPSAKDTNEVMTTIIDALTGFCSNNKVESYKDYIVEEHECSSDKSRSDYDALVRLLADIFR